MFERKTMRLVAVSVVMAIMMILPSLAMAGKKDNSLNVSLERELVTLDFYFQSQREGTVLSQHIYDTLIYRDPDTWEYKPLLAKSFDWVDSVTIDVELRQDIVFHNGEAFDADDVVYTFNFVNDPGSKIHSPSHVNWMRTVEKLGPYKVRIHLHKPFPAAFDYLSLVMPVYPKNYYSEAGPKGFGLKPVGTGPYKVVEVAPGKGLTMVKFEDYFKDSPKPRPSIDKINLRFISELTTKVAELMTGSLDWAWLIPKDQAEKLAKMPDIEVDFAESMRIGFLLFNRVGDTPFKELKVRQAIAHAIDRESIVENLVGEASRVLHSVCYPSQVGCTDEGVKKYDYDPEKARKLLTEAGYPDGFAFDFYAYRDRTYVEAVIGYLHRVGVKANLVYLTWPAFREKWQAKEAPVAFFTWGSFSINDASASTSYFFNTSADDLAQDPKVQEWLQTGDTNIDLELRKKVYQNAHQRISEQMYGLPMFTWVTNTAYNKDLDYKTYADETPRFFMTRWK